MAATQCTSCPSHKIVGLGLCNRCYRRDLRRRRTPEEAERQNAHRAACRLAWTPERMKKDKASRVLNRVSRTPEEREAYKKYLVDWRKNRRTPEQLANKKAYDREWRKSEAGRLSSAASTRRRCATDPLFKIRRRIGVRLSNTLRGMKYRSTLEMLGCSVGELKEHLEKMFYLHLQTGEAMTWDNYGYRGWHIDHKRPLCSFDLSDREQQAVATHFSSLQPLWATDNLAKSERDKQLARSNR